MVSPRLSAISRSVVALDPLELNSIAACDRIAVRLASCWALRLNGDAGVLFVSFLAVKIGGRATVTY